MFSQKHDEYIPPDDEHFSSGTNVFETFMVLENGRIFMLDEHLKRMESSIRQLELGEPPNTDDLNREVKSIAEKMENRNRVMRLNYFPDEKGEPHYSVAFRNGISKRKDGKEGIKLLVVKARRNPLSYLVYHKTGNYLENRIALKQAEKKGFNDALFLNVSGDLAETSKANIFLVKNKVLMTPCVESGILPGIVRAWVLQYAAEQGICVLEVSMNVSELSDSDEIFITNSVIGIVSVSNIEQDGKILYSCSGDVPFTDRISAAYQEACSGNVSSSTNKSNDP
jgi:branched-subunit amino acid aminotransferase/4-amino-4-deoxychorismate lyase